MSEKKPKKPWNIRKSFISFMANGFIMGAALVAAFYHYTFLGEAGFWGIVFFIFFFNSLFNIVVIFSRVSNLIKAIRAADSEIARLRQAKVKPKKRTWFS